MTTLTYGKDPIKMSEITTALLPHSQRRQNLGEESHGDDLYVKGSQPCGRKQDKGSRAKGRRPNSSGRTLV
ncbi:hypothetical protein Lal_00021285 [Lupinus albus]|nr:hypothetical protein Lal_00021285 [Lupinus albus]